VAGQGDSPGIRVALTRPSAFTSPDTHPLVFDQLLASRYDVSWLQWEPETLWQSIIRDFALHTEISRNARFGIQAIKTLHLNDTFFTEWQVANWVTQALDGFMPDFDVLQEATPGQLLHAATVAKLLRGVMEYDEETQRWMAACFLQAGVVYAPPPLEFIQDEIAMSEATCKKCGNVEWAVGLTECPDCGAEKDQLEVAPKYEWKDVQQRWDMIKHMNPETVVLREDRIGVQMARLFAATTHVRECMELASMQLKDLGYAAVPSY